MEAWIMAGDRPVVNGWGHDKVFFFGKGRMMVNVFVGVGYVTFMVRHARSLKDKRQVTKSLRQRLVNLGFSVGECGNTEDLKKATLGFSYVGGEYAHVEKILEEGFRLLLGDFDVVRSSKEIFDFADENEFADPLDEKFYP